jgi:hypothetical protein
LLAVGAVIGEPVSVASFPCFAGKYREICRIQPEEDPNPQGSYCEFNALSADFPELQNRENLRDIRE